MALQLGRRRYAGTRAMVAAHDVVAAQIVRRYNNPERKVFAYLFQLTPEADFRPLIPSPTAVIAAWMDEEGGLIETPVETAIAHAYAIAAIPKPRMYHAGNYTPFQRKQMLARTVLFSVRERDADTVEVHLFSRSVVFTPKGDHDGYELWTRDGDGDWYFAHRPGEEGDTSADLQS